MTKKERLDKLEESLKLFKAEECDKELVKKLQKELAESLELFIKCSGESEVPVDKIDSALNALCAVWEKRVHTIIEEIREKEKDVLYKDIDSVSEGDIDIVRVKFSYLIIKGKMELEKGVDHLTLLEVFTETIARTSEERKRFMEENRYNVYPIIMGREYIGDVHCYKDEAVILEEIMGPFPEFDEVFDRKR